MLQVFDISPPNGARLSADTVLTAKLLCLYQCHLFGSYDLVPNAGTILGMGSANERRQGIIWTNRMAWQWAEILVEIRGTLADIRGTTK